MKIPLIHLLCGQIGRQMDRARGRGVTLGGLEPYTTSPAPLMLNKPYVVMLFILQLTHTASNAG